MIAGDARNAEMFLQQQNRPGPGRRASVSIMEGHDIHQARMQRQMDALMGHNQDEMTKHQQMAPLGR